MSTPEPVSLTVHSVDTPDLGNAQLVQQRQTRMGRMKMLLVLLVCASPVVASYLTYFVIRPGARSNYGELILPTRALPAALALQTLDGQPVKASSLHGQWLLLAVGASTCGADCEKRLFLQRQLREMLGRERDRIDKIWLITDSGTPTPALVTAIEHPAQATLLRVDAQEVAQWLSPAPGHRLEDHLYVVDPMGEWMMRLPADADPARAKRDLDRLLRASSFWDRPGR